MTRTWHYTTTAAFRDSIEGRRYMARLNAQPAWNRSNARFSIISSTGLDPGSNRRQGAPRRIMDDDGNAYASIKDAAAAKRISPNTISKSIYHDIMTHAGQFYVLPEAEYQQILAEKKREVAA